MFLFQYSTAGGGYKGGRLDLDRSLAEHGGMDAPETAPSQPTLSPPLPPPSRSARLAWTVAGVAVAALVAVLFVAYRQPDLLVNFSALRYCG